MNINSTYQKLYENFQSFFKSIATQVVTWQPNNEDEITIILFDDTKLVYNDFLKCIKVIKETKITISEIKIRAKIIDCYERKTISVFQILFLLYFERRAHLWLNSKASSKKN